MNKGNKAKADALGMAHGTAANRLRKMILFSLVCRVKLNMCHQCGGEILSVDDLSIEHKTPWLRADDPVKTFFDLDNIAFSHLSCNAAASVRIKKIFRTSSELKEMKKRCPSRTSAARKIEYAKAKKQGVVWLKK